MIMEDGTDDQQHEFADSQLNRHRRHNSNVEFSFLPNLSSSNSKKLSRLNAIFERAADRKSGGIREDKLSRIIPTTKNEAPSGKYSLFLNTSDTSSKQKKNRIISRGPFLATFEQESAAFINKLAANERADAERRKRSKARKTRNSATPKKKERKQKSSSLAREKRDKVKNNPNEKADSSAPPNRCDDANRERRHTVSDSADIQGLKINAGIEEESDSSSGCVSPTHMKLVCQHDDASASKMLQQSPLSETKRKIKGKKRSQRKDRTRKQNKSTHSERRRNKRDDCFKAEGKKSGEIQMTESFSSTDDSMLRSTFAFSRSDELGSKDSEYHSGGSISSRSLRRNPKQASATHQIQSDPIGSELCITSQGNTEQHGRSLSGEGVAKECEFLSTLMSFFGNILAPQKRQTPIVQTRKEVFPDHGRAGYVYYYSAPNPWSGVQEHPNGMPVPCNTQRLVHTSAHPNVYYSRVY